MAKTLRSIDLTGQTFHKFTVVRLHTERSKWKRPLWVCLCVCGNTRIMSAGDLRRGHPSHCGECTPPKTCWGDLSGKIFNKLTIVRWAGGRGLWVADCACGNTGILVKGHAVANGIVKGCGCTNHADEKRLAGIYPALGESGFKRLYGTYKKRAKKGGLAWELDLDAARALFTSKCAYCGKPPSRTIRGTWALHERNNFYYNGLDRVDNSRGYTSNNVVAACRPCNQAKHTLSEAEFKRMIVAVYTYWILGNKTAVAWTGFENREDEYGNFK